MNKLLLSLTVLMTLLIGCSPNIIDTSEFDSKLENILAEPYNPSEGSKY